jgi:putative ABC transport system permease protein
MTSKLIWKNLWFKKGNLLLSLLLYMLGTSIISLLLLVQHGIGKKLDRDLQNIDMVVGAKGSPLQLVLSAVYHADAPTGNISYQKLQEATRGPLVEQVIPLAYGDTYQGYRILGTTTDYLKKYGGELASGQLFTQNLQAVLGSKVTEISGLSLQAKFHGTHGEAGETHEEQNYVVSGILKPSGTVLDYLILTNIETVWTVHHHEEAPARKDSTADAEPEAHHHDDEPHDEAHNHAAGHHDEDMEITAALIKFRSPMAVISFPRIINAQTNFQAVNPTLEINRLQGLMNLGASTLQSVALAIMVVSIISVFVVLYTRLRERRYELALMRTMGAGRSLLAGLLLAEGVLLALAGTVLGLLLSRLALWFISRTDQVTSQIPFTFGPLPAEGLLLAAALAAGLLAALLPAVKAYRLNISETLSNG